MTDGATLVEETESDTAELGDELFRVAEDTTADGRVRVEILELNKRAGGDEIAVTARLPSLTEFTERMAYPERDDPEYKFVRLCRAAGYSLAAAEQLDGATVEAEQDDDGEWVLCAPEQYTRADAIEEISEKAFAVGGALFALSILPLVVTHHLLFDEEPDGGLDPVDYLILIGGSTAVWLAFVGAAWLVFMAVTDPTALLTGEEVTAYV